MLQGLLPGDERQLILWGVPEGTARRGEDEFGYLGAVARPQALMRAVVLAIDRD